MQVMVGCGTVCSFHVGGAVEGSLGDQKSVKRWEFFIGDCPHATGTDPMGRRQPLAQVFPPLPLPPPPPLLPP